MYLRVRKGIIFLGNNGTITRPTNDSESVVFTCGKRFLVATKPIYIPSHRARLIKKQQEDATDI
jgi:hypothetical protein